jgi:glycerophosphoryl diester phosphodiesterase
MIRKLAHGLAGLFGLYVVTYLGNLPFRSTEALASFDAVAHRGVHHTFPTDNLTNNTCTAELIYPPEHSYIENTLPSMRAAFDAGATRIEIDVHRTADGDLAVFHDWTLDCRTDGSGETRSATVAYLKSLDVGYGYTADGGQSFPLRGLGIGAIPTLREVLAAFPDGQFVIDQKDRDRPTTELIAAQLRESDALARVCLAAIPARNAEFEQSQPDGCTFASREAIKRCLVDYLKSGWYGAVPDSCAGRRLIVPAGGLSRLLWGWPGTFLDRMHARGTRVYVWTHDASDQAHWANQGFDGLWTDRIEQR